MKQYLLALFCLVMFVGAKSQTFYMCGTTSQTVTVNNGTIYDCGGPSGNYSYYTNADLLIEAPCPGDITLHFNSFDLESGYDYLYIYDGTSASDPLINWWTGTGTVPDEVAHSGNMYLVFTSDGVINQTGFDLSYSFSNPSCGPTANFNYSVNTCQGVVTFSDASTYSPTTWLWNFGDGNANTVQNPTHTYTTAGTYSVTLIATNSFGNSTLTQTVSVNPISFNIGYNGALLANSALSFTTDNTSGQVYTWNFGDGHLGGTANSIHTYTALGTYTVGLTVASGSCVTTKTISINITNGVGVGQQYIAPYVARVSPNPSMGDSQLSLQLAENRPVRIEVVNQLGQLVTVISDGPLAAGEYKFQLDLPAGVHYVTIHDGEKSNVLKVVSLR